MVSYLKVSYLVPLEGQFKAARNLLFLNLSSLYSFWLEKGSYPSQMHIQNLLDKEGILTPFLGKGLFLIIETQGSVGRGEEVQHSHIPRPKSLLL
jgi:hypothetical protein